MSSVVIEYITASETSLSYVFNESEIFKFKLNRIKLRDAYLLILLIEETVI